MRRLLAYLSCSLALAPIVPYAAAAVPSAANSTLPPCLALCPLGDLPLVVVVRDAANNPIVNSTVALDFSQCPGAHLCEGWPTDPYVVDVPSRTLRAVTDASGSIDFHARVGGTGGPGSVRVYADGVPLRTFALASPDQNGDGYVYEGPPVGGNDLSMFALKLGTADPTADFTCDGVVNDDDRIVVYYHYAQSCMGWIDPVKKSTWGELKTHYR